MIVALVLVLVGRSGVSDAAGYVVYDEAGSARPELPFLRQGQEEPDDTPLPCEATGTTSWTPWAGTPM